jgi:uncharacterized integral membrane protein
MFGRVVTILFIVPLAVILIALAFANRAPVAFTMDPFNPGNPALTLQMPLFVFAFLVLVVGVLLGSFSTWLRQGRYRRIARQKTTEAEALKARADEQRRAETARRSQSLPALPDRSV